MKITLPIILLIFVNFIYSQETFSEFDKSNNGFEIEKVKNSDLQLIKEIFRDNKGKILSYYNYDPKKGKLDGDFDNSFYSGNYKNGLINSENYLHFLNPSSSNNVLFIQGRIVAGKLDGYYDVFLRTYDTQSYNEQFSTKQNYIRGEFTKDFSNYLNWPKFSDKLVGEIYFENGMYLSYSFINENKKYFAKFTKGILDYYIVKDLSNNRNIDSFKVACKIFLQNGIFQKNIYPPIVDSLDKLRKSNITTFNYNETGFEQINLIYYSGQQFIPIIDPLKFKFEIKKRKIATPTISFIENDLSKINLIPSTTTGNGEWSIIGVGSETESWEKYTFPSDALISKCIKSEKISIPFFEFSLDIKKIIELYGTVNGYKLFYQLLDDLTKKNLEILNKNYSSSNANNVTFTFNELQTICEKQGHNLSEFQILQLEKIKKQEEDEIIASLAIKARPEYPGGMGELMRFINQNLIYPAKAKEEGRSGKTIIKFYVDENGSVSNLEIEVKSYNCVECDEEAIRIAKKISRWLPGQVDGKNISSTISIPFNFKLQ